jgi:hypothetical protein
LKPARKLVMRRKKRQNKISERTNEDVSKIIAVFYVGKL